jgi:hypothetical protein
MPKLKILATGHEIPVAANPVYDPNTRHWECGDQRFADWEGDLFEPMPDPPAPAPARTTFTRVEFQTLLLTANERIAIRAKRLTDPYVDDLLSLIEQAGEVDLDNPATQAGTLYLTTTTPPILTPARAAEVLTGVPVNPFG